MIVLAPTSCADCGERLPTAPSVDDPATERAQLTEVPALSVEVTEYRLEARRWARCGAVTRAERPPETGPGSFGPRLQALVAAVSGRYRLSRREVVPVLSDRWGVELALGSVVELEQATSAALAPVVEAALAAAQQAQAALCWQLGSTLWPALWSFARYEGVEPTNNPAERALRPAVLWRKGSFGCHSPAGSRFAERLLTTTATCRQQRRNLVEFLVDTNPAARRGTPPPSLVAGSGRVG